MNIIYNLSLKYNMTMFQKQQFSYGLYSLRVTCLKLQKKTAYTYANLRKS